MKKEFYDMKVRFFGVLIVTIALFFIVAPFQKFTVSILEGYSGNPQLEKFLPGAMLSKLKEWNFYINSQWYGKNFGQMIGIIGIIMAFPLFAREFENETIVFLLVRKPRKWIYFNKVFAGAIATLIVMLVGSILPAIYSAVAGKEYNYSVIPNQLGVSIFEKNSVDFRYTLGIIVVCLVITWIGYLVFERKEV
ncbi:ABC transporter permease subunit [Fervidobacterium pennivorans]|uniref:ABC transporter permease subunit n=1 Tax=Fervidobacterium pennivorans TaxID=93466 RepID=UPI00143697F8|nr:ABC transporter permease subunit [Fervidobacterium pennivorans]QIV78148.1 ABC transporter permease subunit [Fervidobacterium pennivorans subsp. keratinolyticus]